MDALAETPQTDLADLIDRLADLGERSETVSIADIKNEIGERSFGPALAVPAIVELSPIGGIPGLPTIIALIVGLIAVQMLLGRDHLWLPGFLERRQIGGGRMAQALRKVRRPMDWLDSLLRPRMTWMTRPPAIRVIAGLCVLLCLTVPPLELLPFASSIPMGAVALMGLGLMARDGLVMAGAAALSSATFWALFEIANGKA